MILMTASNTTNLCYEYIIKTMKIFVVIIASLVLTSGIVYSQVQKSISHKQEETVLSANTQDDLVNESVEEENTVDENVSSYTQEMSVTPTPLPTRTPSVSDEPQTNTTLDNFIYPGSEAVNSSDSSLLLRSSDETENITNWYKEKITSEHMNAKSFVATKTNGNILNKLVGANGELEIVVEIKKEPVKNYSDITVSIIGD